MIIEHFSIFQHTKTYQKLLQSFTNMKFEMLKNQKICINFHKRELYGNGADSESPTCVIRFSIVFEN